MASPASLDQCLFTLDAMPAHFRPTTVEPIWLSPLAWISVQHGIPFKSSFSYLRLVFKLKRSSPEEGFQLVNAFLDRHEGEPLLVKGKLARHFCSRIYRDDRITIPSFFSIQSKLYRWLLEDGRDASQLGESLDWQILAALLKDAATKMARAIKLCEEPDQVRMTLFKDGWEDAGQLPRENLASLSGAFLLATTFEEGQLAEILELDVSWPYHAPAFTWKAPGTWLISFPLQRAPEIPN